jgi:protein ImuB
MCAYLPGWPLQRLGHNRSALRGLAVAVVDPQAARGPRVVLASRRALRSGVRPGMPLAEARALEPGLSVHDYDPEADRRELLQLAKAAERYSPVTLVEEGPAPQALLLDVAGSAHCFGGEAALLDRAARDYADGGWLVRLALADTVGAVWAFSRHAPSPCLVPAGATRAMLAPLPAAALRLPAETLGLLSQLGLGTVGDLLALPRPDLAARFGPLLLLRLDQALGRVPEVVARPEAEPELQAAQAFDFPVDRLDVLCQAIDQLAEDVHRALSRRDLGARQLECRLYPEAGPPVAVEVGLYRPSRCPRYLAGLLRTRLEQVRLEEPVCAVRLGVTRAERLVEVQPALFEQGGPDDIALAGLIDRLSNLLGRQAVTRPRCVADAQPEYAFRFEPALRPPEELPAPGLRRSRRRKADEEDTPAPPAPRPLSVWPEPAAVDVVAAFPDGPPVRFRWGGAEWRVSHWWGPERIETGWWRGADVRRDYYVVTTHAGSRFWMFRRRDEGGWFLHGCFD